MLTDNEIAERRLAARNALANQRLAGLEPDPWVIEQTERWIVGEVEISDIIESYHARLKGGDAPRQD